MTKETYMKTVICAIAKNEDKYISDFCMYHLAIGFDEIHIYDNGTEIQYQNEKIIVHPFRNVRSKGPQLEAYNNFLKTVDYDWAAFIDIDEFVTLDGYENIKEYLSSFTENVDSVRLYEKVYGDGGKITDENLDIPVYERITEQSMYVKGAWGKSLIRKRDDWHIVNPHKFVRKVSLTDAYSDGKIASYRTLPRSIRPSEIVYDKCYIRHYKTKTLSEFCDQKLNTQRVFDQTKKRTIDYFFRVNEKTPEKIAYLKSRGIEVE